MTVLVAGVWGALLLLPAVVHDAYFLNGMILVLIYGSAAQAWNLLGGYGGQLSFGHAVFFGLGAYTSTLLFSRAGVSPWAGMWAGALVATGVSLVVGYPTFRLRRHYFALATLALAEVVRISFLNWPFVGAAVGLYLPVQLMNRPGTMMWSAKPPYYYLALALFGLACALALVVDRTRVGLYLRTIDQDEEAASALGIPGRRYKLLAMALSAAVTALAGTLFAQYVLYVDPSSVLDASRSVLFAVMALVGGRGTVVGPAVGAGFLTLLSQYAGGLLGGFGKGYDYVVYGVAIMLVAVYEPRGIVGLLDRFAPGRRRGVPGPAEPAGGEGARVPSSPAQGPRPARPLLRVEALWKRFGGLEALRDVSLEVRRGEIVGVLGPNGAGKSTLFDCVTGFLRPDGGSILLRSDGAERRLEGRPPAWIAQQGLARTFQMIRVFPGLTVWQNMLAGQEHRGESLADAFRPTPRAVRERLEGLLRLVGLWDQRDLAAGQLSYGQQKLLALAMALVRRPSVVLLDEPVAGVNPTMIQRLMEHIRLQNAEGVTFLIIEHNMDVLMELANRVYFMADGRVVAEGSPEAIQANDDVLALYYGR
jgi:branched-chain amino acid transport system permease protein